MPSDGLERFSESICSKQQFPLIFETSSEIVTVSIRVKCKRTGRTVSDKTPNFNFDGFAKSPTSVLRCILRHCDVRKVSLIPQNLRALNLELFALPSKWDFVRDHQF
jgi:hypothetical protein